MQAFAAVFGNPIQIVYFCLTNVWKMTDTTLNRRDQIIQISSRMFRKKGYESTTMRDIAFEVGMEAASLYHHIQSKDEILNSICFQMAEKFSLVMKEVNDIYFNAEERLRMAIKMHVELLTDNLDYSFVFLHEWRSLKEPHLAEFIKLRHAYENEFRLLVRHGIDEDVFDHVEEKFAVLSILSSVNWITEWYKPDGAMNPSEIATHISDFIMGGLRKKYITEIGYKP